MWTQTDETVTTDTVVFESTDLLTSEDVIPMSDSELDSIVSEPTVAKTTSDFDTNATKVKQDITLEIAKLVASGEKSVAVIASKLDIPNTTNDERIKFIKTCRVAAIKKLKEALSLLTDDNEIQKINEIIKLWESLILKEAKVKVSRQQKKIDWTRQIISTMMPDVEYQAESE